MKHKELTEKIIGCAMTVQNTLGNGFQEVIYQRTLNIKLNLVGIEHQREFDVPIYYRNEGIGTRSVDFLVNGDISVEMKALIPLEDVHLAQAINYLEAYNIETGLLINFGAKKLEFKQVFKNHFKENPSLTSFHHSKS